MDTYNNIKLIIRHLNTQVGNGAITQGEYVQEKEDLIQRMDTFLLCKRISSERYEELFAMFVSLDERDELK